MKKINKGVEDSVMAIMYLHEWEDSTDDLVNYFISKYFGNFEDSEHWWVADEIGGVLYVNDYWFSVSDIVDFIRYKYSKKMMFKYYDYKLEYGSKEKHSKNDYLINIKSYKYVK